MFFDRKKTEIDYKGLLIQLALEQWELFFHQEGRESVKMKEIKIQLRQNQNRKNAAMGIPWWELPWETVFEQLVIDVMLPENQSSKNWDLEYELLHKEKDGYGSLVVSEHGRIYGYHVLRDEWEYNRDSKYSESEQRQMVSDYNKQINQYEWVMAATTEGPVYSSISDRAYDSMTDYLWSMEHWFIRDHFSDKYARSLYTERETHHLSVESSNTHCRRFFEAGAYHVTEGVLDLLQPGGYRIIGMDGLQVWDEKEPLKGMDSAVLCAEYLAQLETVQRVPVELFTSDVKKAAVTYKEAIRQAEMFTCLAKKLA